jgi:hypothetical protein
VGESGAEKLNVKTTIGTFILLAAIATASIVHAQDTNAPASQPAPTNSPIIPLIKMTDVPITTVIEGLAREAGINYMIDPYWGRKLTGSAAEHIPEPLVTFRLQNVSARDALTRMLTVRNFALIEDPVTGITRITRPGQATNAVDASLLGMDTNNPAPYASEIIPLIQFSDVPLDTALENLIRQSGVPVVLDSRLTDNSDPLDQIPELSLRWTNLTVRQAIIALCVDYDLVIVKDAMTGGVRIEPNAARKPHHLWHPEPSPASLR